MIVPPKEFIDKEKRDRTNYLVWDTLNILSCTILTFPFFSPHMGETELKGVRVNYV